MSCFKILFDIFNFLSNCLLIIQSKFFSYSIKIAVSQENIAAIVCRIYLKPEILET